MHTLRRVHPWPNGTAITRTKHGARSLVEIRGRASEVAEGLRETMALEELWRPLFGVTVEAASIVLVRMERAARFLEEVEADPAHDPELTARLRSDLRGWATAARGYLNDLGLTPASLARIFATPGWPRRPGPPPRWRS